MRDELIASLVRRADPIQITTALGEAAAQFAELAGLGRGSDLTASEMMDWWEAGGSGLTNGSCPQTSPAPGPGLVG
jgi:hypothetical protein